MTIRAEDLAVAAPPGALWRVGVIDATTQPPAWSEEQLTAGTWGSVSPDPMRDLAKVAVIDPATGQAGAAFLRGLGLQAGALAVTIADGRVVVAGSSDAECAAAANAVIDDGLRAAVTVGGRVVASWEDGSIGRVVADLGSPVGDPVTLLEAAVTTGAIRLTERGPVDPSGQRVGGIA